jgi:hypothetical protein
MNDESGMTSPHPGPLPSLQERRGGREKLLPNPKARLREQFHEVCRFKHLALRSEEAYWVYIRQFMVFHREKAETLKAESRNGGWRHPRDLGKAEVEAFLSHLTTARKVAVSTQNQAA